MASTDGTTADTDADANGIDKTAGFRLSSSDRIDVSGPIEIG